jgi:hypothetical protein
MELALPETPFRLVLNSLDILLLKNSCIFHFVRHFNGTRKNITTYSHNLSHFAESCKISKKLQQIQQFVYFT